MIEAGDVFNPKDFQSVKLRISFENLTTKWKPPIDENLGILEIGDKQLVFELPLKSCSNGHSGFIKIESYNYETKKFQELFTSTGKIVDAESTDDTIRVTFDLVQFDEKSWNDFTTTFAKRQEEIMRFFQMVKG